MTEVLVRIARHAVENRARYASTAEPLLVEQACEMGPPGPCVASGGLEVRAAWGVARAV